MEDRDRYPIGQQNFKMIRQGNAYYIDKTQYIEKIVRSESKFYFLSRPRRFGKSLFLSSLEYFFKGERDLFKGLYIDSFNWDWQPYPVLRLDLNTDKYADQGILDGVLDRIFRNWEKLYDVDVKDSDLSQRFSTIIQTAHEKTGKQVVVLVDEYDKPLVGNLKHEEIFDHYRKKLASIYSNFKSSAEHIRLVFLTGISRFSRLSVFSDLNNLNDISFDDAYADICGITEKELYDNFHEGIEKLAAKRQSDFVQTCQMLKQNYDGYRFAPEGSDIYNTWSLLNCLSKGRIGSYWNRTGAASIIAEVLHNADVDINAILNAQWDFDKLAGLDLRNADPTALLYQAGYLTIDDYDVHTDEVLLKVPNKEVKKGLFNDLVPFYIKGKEGYAESIVNDIIKSIRNGKPDILMNKLDAYFSNIPYDLKMENENNFQNAFYILISLIGIDAQAEVHTSDGRIDLLIQTPKYIYIIEIKYNATPKQAIQQIEEKQYSCKCQDDSRQLFKIGVSFSSKTRRIESWIIERE